MCAFRGEPATSVARVAEMSAGKREISFSYIANLKKTAIVENSCFLLLRTWEILEILDFDGHFWILRPRFGMDGRFFHRNWTIYEKSARFSQATVVIIIR